MNSTPNLELAARIAEFGLTEVEIADLLNDAIEDKTGKRRKVSDRYVRLLLSGQIRWPWPDTRTAIEDVFQMSVLDLGFAPPGRSSSRGRRPARTLGSVTEGGPVDRREVLGIAGGVVITVVIPALPSRGRLGMSDVDRLRTPLGELIKTDNRIGGVTLAAVASQQAKRILGAVEHYELSTRVERSLYALAGEYLAVAGWFSTDADELDVAGEFLNQALRTASIARDPLLQAQIWNYMAMRARQARAYTEAHAVAKAGLDSTAARRNPKVAALFHARVAHGHAFRGEYGSADRSLGRARAALGRVKDDTPTPQWVEFFDEAELDGLAAIAFNALGRYDRAEDLAQRDLNTLSGTYVRNRAHVVLHLAEARLGYREAEQAAHDATAALHLADQITGGVRTGRVASRLASLRRRFDQWSQVPAARDWIEAYDTALAAS